MTILKATGFPSGAPPRPLLDGVRRALRGGRGLIVLGSLALGLGAAFNWSWLVAAGIAPLLLSALPCAAMCALGLCMSKMGVGSRETASHVETPRVGQDMANS